MTFNFHSIPYVISRRFVLCGSLDGVGQEAEDGTNPQQNGEATKQLTTKLDPFGGGGGWSQGIGSISGQILCCLCIGQTLLWEIKTGEFDLCKIPTIYNSKLLKTVCSI